MRDSGFKDLEDERAEALDAFCSQVHVDKEHAMMKFQDLRDYANKLAWELAHRENFDVPPVTAAKKALKAQEYEDVLKQLDEMAFIFEGVSLDWERVAADRFADDYVRVEVYAGDCELP